jgi:hypothetical protein
MVRSLGGVVLLVALASEPASAQFGVAWRHSPKIAVVGPAGDARQKLVDEAVAFWNRTLAGIGSGFRLGPIARVTQPVPEEALQQLSESTLASGGRTANVPPALRGPPGDISVYLAASGFISFASPFDENSKRIVGIRGLSHSPMTLPNVARNVIAHELGHAIGLRHNNDPATLMCGRPALCRPALFQSDAPRMFPLTSVELGTLGSMYPSSWRPR